MHRSSRPRWRRSRRTAGREEALAQGEPEPFDRVQLRAVGRQVDQADGGRDGDGVGGVPARLVHQQGGMGARWQALGEAVEEDLHGGGVGVGQHQGERIAGAGAHGTIQPSRAVSPVEARAGTLAALEPDAGAAALLSHPGLVLTPELQLCAGMGLGDGTQDRGKSPLLDCSCAALLACG